MKYSVQQYVEDKEFVSELLVLMRNHGIERLGKDVYAPDTTRILNLWKSGVLKLVVGKSDSGKLVAYQAWIFTPSIYKTVNQAVCGPVFVSKELRGSVSSIRDFLMYGVSAMRILGAGEVFTNVDADQMAIGHMLSRAKLAKPISTQMKFL
jgi:hypothetical protein